MKLITKIGGKALPRLGGQWQDSWWHPSSEDITGSSTLDYDRSWSSQEWKVRLRHTIDQGNLIKLLGMRCNKYVLIMETLFLDGNAQSVRYGGEGFMMDQGNLIVLTPKKWQIPKFSSWVMTQQNLRIK